MKKALHRLSYMTGVQTFGNVVRNACAWLRTLDVRDGFDLTCRLIANGEFKVFSVPTMVFKDGSWIHSEKKMVHCGFRPDGTRLITDGEMLLRRTQAEVEGVSPMVKRSLDHDASVLYRFNPEIMAAAKGISRDNPDDLSLAQREYFDNSVREFYLPTKLEVRRERCYADGGGVTYQGGDGCRAVVEYAKAYKVDSANRDYTTALIEQEYKITVAMAKNIRANAREFLQNPEKYGVMKKPYRALAAAICLTEMWADEATRFIVYQDGSQSGYQGMGIAFGCPHLCTLTNLGPEVHDMYGEVGILVRLPKSLSCYSDLFLSRNTSKHVIIRAGYGASDNAIVKSMLLNNPDKDDLDMFDDNGVTTDLIVKLIQEKPELLNPDYRDFILAGGAREAVCGLKAVAHAYSTAIYGVSPRLREAVQLLRSSATSVLGKGGVITLPLACGGEYALFSPEVDRDGTPIRLRKKVGGVEISVSMLPLKNGATASMLAPDFMHGAWDSQVRHLGNVMASIDGIPTSDIHDSHGTSPAFAIQAKEQWREAYISVGRCLPVSFLHLLRQGGVEDPAKTNPRPWDLELIRKSSRFIK